MDRGIGMANSFFDNIERKTGVSMDEIFALANAIQHADFQNERHVRKIVRKVGRMANKNITQQTEDLIVASIIKDGKSLDFDAIQRMMK